VIGGAKRGSREAAVALPRVEGVKPNGVVVAEQVVMTEDQPLAPRGERGELVQI